MLPKIVQLFVQYIKVRRTTKSHRENISAIDNTEKHQMELKSFLLWTKDEEDTVKNESDLQFLKSIKTDGMASIADRI